MVSGGVGSAYPTYYAAKLMPYFAAHGDTVVSRHERLSAAGHVRGQTDQWRADPAGDQQELLRPISPPPSISSGYVPYTNATVYSYGIPQDEAARTGIGSPDIVHSSLTGVHSMFTNTFAPFSVSVIVMSPAAEPPFTPANLAATGSNAAVALSWDAAAGASSYIVKRSLTSGGGYADRRNRCDQRRATWTRAW